MQKFFLLVCFLWWCCVAKANSFYSKIENQQITFIDAQTGIVLLKLNLKKAFIEAAEQEVKTKESFGSFHFKEKKIREYKTIAINSIDSNTISLTINGKLNCKDKWVAFKLHFTTDKDGLFRWYATIQDEQINYVAVRFESVADEQFLGFGEQYSYLNFKGKKFDVFTTEQGIGKGDAPITFFTKLAGVSGDKFTTYCAIPYTLSTHKRGLLVENRERVSFDLKQAAILAISARSNEISGIVWTGNTPKEITKKYTAYSGRMPLLPDWAFGSILGLQGGIEKVKNIVNETQKTGTPIAAVWIQDWVGKRQTKLGSRLYWNWLPDTATYPNIKKFIGEMNSMNIKVLGYVNTFLADYGPQTDEALDKGYVVKNQQGEPYKLAVGGFDAYMVDLSNPKAYNWLKQIIKTQLIGNGFSGWMADFSEALPFDAKLYNNTTASSYHNYYPVEWARLNREAINESGKEGEIFFFNRAGYNGSLKHSNMFWAGDQMTSWQKHDGLPSALNAMLSSGISGISLNHSDVGGYTSVNRFPIKYIRNQELLFRWIEMNTFSPILRTHEGLLPIKNYQFYSDSVAQQFFARFAKIHLGLKNYLQYYNEEASTKGYPIIRQVYFEYPENKNSLKQEHAFMLGSDIFVAPVLNKKGKVNFTLPEGEWQQVWTKEIVNTNNKNVVVSKKVALGYPEVYIKTDSKFYKELLQVFDENK